MFTLDKSTDVFKRFLAIVVREGVFSDDERSFGVRPRSEAEKARAAKRGHDFRPPRLVRISGKGGYVEGTAFTRRSKFRNVTLLDHLVSVTRGALVFAEIDLREAGVEVSSLPSRLAAIAATAFLHDADKILEMSRLEELDESQIEELAARFRVDMFLEEHGVSITSLNLLQRIGAVEISRVDRLVPGSRLLTQDEINDCAYVRLADRLDGAFLDEAGGQEGVVRELNCFGGLRTGALKHGWRATAIASPHTPFLLDALQDAFAAAVLKRAGIPPLIETHHDGCLFLVAPDDVFDAALDDAIVDMGSVLKRGLRVDVNLRGTRDLLDGGSSLEDVRHALENDARTSERALFIHVDVLEVVRVDLLSTFDSMEFGVRLDGLQKFRRKHFSCWPMAGNELPETAETRVWSATFAVALSCAPPKDRTLAKKIPDAAAREKELVRALAMEDVPAPEWILDVPHDLSRHTLLAVYAACKIQENEELRERLTGDCGVVRVWLEGDGRKRPGLFEKVGDPGAVLATAAGDWLRAAASRTFSGTDEERFPGRCHFTAMPLDASARINSKTGLYGLNVSAFSGREGRPEFHNRTEAATLVAPAAAAEHRLRALEAGRAGGDVPVLVSSPTCAGLFASLSLQDGPSLDRYSLYDLLRMDAKPGQKLYIDTDSYERRLAVGRYDAMPHRMLGSGTSPGLISFVKIVIDSAIRTGRAIHVFRGLPRPTNAFVAFDFLPDHLAQAVGGAELRLEQLPMAKLVLEQIERIAETSGLGLEAAMRVLDPTTRFGASCEVLAMIGRLDEDKQKTLGSLRNYLLEITRDPSMQTKPHDSVIIEFATAMARVQGAPRREASNSERDLGMRIALAQTDEASRIGQTSRESLVAAIATGLENEFDRSTRLVWRGKKFGLDFPRRKAVAAAEVFVDLVWPHAFGSSPPAGRERRVAFAIYRTAFETASYLKHDADNGADTTA